MKFKIFKVDGKIEEVEAECLCGEKAKYISIPKWTEEGNETIECLNDK